MENDPDLGQPPTGLQETLGITTLTTSRERVEMQMTAEGRGHPQFGIGCGSACVALAESAAWTGTALRVSERTSEVLVTQTNIRYFGTGKVDTLTAVAQLLTGGRQRDVWGIDIRDDAGNHVAIARSTVCIGSPEPYE